VAQVAQSASAPAIRQPEELNIIANYRTNLACRGGAIGRASKADILGRIMLS
jgi:hypothetical protein